MYEHRISTFWRFHARSLSFVFIVLMPIIFDGKVTLLTLSPTMLALVINLLNISDFSHSLAQHKRAEQQ